jgi:hypothetical protein
MKFIFLIVGFFASIGLNSCKHKQTEHSSSITPTEKKGTFIDIQEYYLRNHWNYPVEIKIDTIHQEGEQLSGDWAREIDTLVLKKKLSEWAMATFTYNVEACLLKQVTVTNESKKALFFYCNIYYYRKRDLSDSNIVAPIEGQGIVENSFYVRSERAYFSYDNQKLKFLHWFQS